MRPRLVVRAALTLVAGMFAATGVVACTSTSTSTSVATPAVTAPTAPAAPPRSPSGSAAPAYCQAEQDLKAAVTALGSINVLGGGVSAVQSALTDVQANLNKFQTEAGSQFGPQVDQMRNSLNSAKTAAQDAQANPSTSTLTKLATAVAGVITSFKSLATAVGSRCG